MNLTEAHIEKLAPNERAYKAGKKLAPVSKWTTFNKSKRAIWGAIKGSGKNPYNVSIDTVNLAYKCSCPSRQFPCKHSVALLLLNCNDGDALLEAQEPAHVADWLNKRHAKTEEKEAPKELTEEEKAKRAASRAKTAAKRYEAVNAGVEELEQWLKDLVRLGLLELPSKDYAFFENTAAKMTDAKAPGLAARVRSFNELNYNDQNGWQEGAFEIIGQLYLLIKSYNQQSKEEITPYLQTIKSLIGWNFKKKDIIGDPDTHKVKDKWLILGSDLEMLDELTVYRKWVLGLNTGTRGYLLDFETRFSTEIPFHQIIDGMTIDEELYFYPGNFPYRAIYRSTEPNGEPKILLSNPINQLKLSNKYSETWDELHQSKVKQFTENPWMNNQFYIIKNVRFVKAGNDWIVCDKNKKYQQIRRSVYQYSNDKILTMVLLANQEPVDLSFVEYNDGILPLGIFKDENYICL